jgi:class 3 adenylate cyclase
MSFDIDVRAVAPAIRVPTLILHAEGDRICHVENGRFLAREIPDARYVELPGADHLPWFETDPAIGEIREFLTGVRVPKASDRVLATVLFTDVVESTSTAAEVGDQRWREILESHNTIVRDQLTRFRGTEVNTTGDGFLATFDGPARAIRCAHEIAHATGGLGIAVRAGIHTGEVERLGGDIAGIAVHIAARIANQAGPGEVVVSGTVSDLVAGSGIEFEYLGERELRGVPGKWRTYAAIG